MEEIKLTLRPEPKSNWFNSGFYFARQYTIKFKSPFRFVKGDRMYCSKFDGYFDYYHWQTVEDGIKMHRGTMESTEMFEIHKSLVVEEMMVTLLLKDQWRLENRKDYRDDSPLELTIERQTQTKLTKRH